MFADYHVHTIYSDDSEYPVEEIIKDAISMGINEICFTDHVDYGIKRDWDDPRGIQYRKGGPGEPEKMPLANVNYPKFMDEICELKKKYRDQICIRTGMEFGIQTHTIQEFERLFARYSFDFIILSIHQIDDKEFWTQEFQEGRTQQEYIEQYYEELLAIIKRYHHYSVLGHVDLIKRYDRIGNYPFEKIKPILTKIFRILIEEGKGIEVNTSSFRYGLNDLMPSRDILKLYRELGGTIITIGSDSHKKEHLGAHIPTVKEELRKLGYTQYCVFENMRPIFVDL